MPQKQSRILSSPSKPSELPDKVYGWVEADGIHYGVLPPHGYTICEYTINNYGTCCISVSIEE